MMDETDWRGGDYKMTDLISRLHSRPDRDAFSDVTFSLPDGSQLKAHRFVLAMASPVFEAQFFGPLAASNNNSVTIKDVDSTAFRRLIDCIYKSSTDFLQTEINIKEDFQDYWLLLQAAHMYLVKNVMDTVCSDYIVKYVNDMFYLNKAQRGFNEILANENLSYLVDIMNQACGLSIYDDIADSVSICVVNQLPGIVERDLLNKFSDNAINRIVQKFEEGVFWEGDATASLVVVYDIQRNNYNAPEILQTCFDSEIRRQYNSNTNWSLWEQENNKIEMYCELLRFAHGHNLLYMVEHCKIRLARKIVTWTKENSEDVFDDLQERAEDSEIFKELVELAEEIMRKKK